VKHFSPRSQIGHTQLGTTYTNGGNGTGTYYDIKDVAGQHDALGLVFTHAVLVGGVYTPARWPVYVKFIEVGPVGTLTGVVNFKIWREDTGALLYTVGSVSAPVEFDAAKEVQIHLGPAAMMICKDAFDRSYDVIVGFELVGGDVDNYLEVDTGGVGAIADGWHRRNHGGLLWDADYHKVNGVGVGIHALTYLYSGLYYDHVLIQE